MSWRAHGTLFLLATIAALALASDLEQPRTASAHSHYFYTLKPIVIGRDNQSTTAIVKSFVVGDTVTLSHSDCPDGVELDYEEAVTAVLAADPANQGWAAWDITASVSADAQPGSCKLTASDGTYSRSHGLPVIPASEENTLKITKTRIFWRNSLTVQWEPHAPPGLWQHIPPHDDPGSKPLSRYNVKAYSDEVDREQWGIRGTWFYLSALGKVVPSSLYTLAGGFQPGTLYCVVVRLDLNNGEVGPWSDEFCRRSPGTRPEPAVTLTPGLRRVDEGGPPAAYTLRLLVQPSGPVTVTPLPEDPDVTVAPTTLTFTPQDYSRERTFLVSAAADDDDQDDVSLVRHTASGGGYDAVHIPTVVVTVIDTTTTTPTVSARASTSTMPGGGAVVLDGTASDPQNNALTYAWTSDGGGTFTNDRALHTVWTAPAAGVGDREVTLTLTVTDTAGASATATVVVTVLGNAPPRPIITGGGGGGGGGPSGPTPSDEDFEWNVTRDIEELASGHDVPTGLWSDGTTLWLLENGPGADDAIYAYDLESGERREKLEFELDSDNRTPRGVWSDRSTIWISDSGKEKLFAHDLESGERLPDSDLALHPDNDDPRGIWSDDSTMWVLDSRDNALFAYDLASGELLAEYALDDDNGDPRGLWSDGTSAWVSDDRANRLFAYRLPSIEDDASEDEDLELERVRDEEFWKLSRASNNSPRGLWSDGDVMYVADASDGKVYSYNMPDAIDARLASFTLSGVDFGEFDSAQAEYTGVADDGVTETTVGAEAAQSGAAVVIKPDDDDGDPENGHQVALEEVSEITVTVTSADESRERVYRVLVGDSAQEAPCFRGAVALGFSLVVYAGGSVEELVDCAQSRHGTALYTLHDGGYVPYILGVPEFVNSSFGELFAGGVPASTPLIIKSDGPPTADPAGSITGEDRTPPWPECLRGTVATGFSLVLYQGGVIEELVACAESRDITAIYALDEGGYFPYILGAPEFVNRDFRELFTGGLPATSPLIVKSDGVSAAGATAGAP